MCLGWVGAGDRLWVWDTGSQAMWVVAGVCLSEEGIWVEESVASILSLPLPSVLASCCHCHLLLMTPPPLPLFGSRGTAAADGSEEQLQAIPSVQWIYEDPAGLRGSMTGLPDMAEFCSRNLACSAVRVSNS